MSLDPHMRHMYTAISLYIHTFIILFNTLIT